MKPQIGNGCLSLEEKKKVNRDIFHINLEVDLNDEKNDSQPTIIDTEDNWIAKFLCGGPVGLTVNFTLLLAATIYFIKFDDNESHRKIIDPLWTPKAVQFFAIVFPIEILLNALIVLILYQLSRLSRSTVYYGFLGALFTAIIFLVMFSVRHHLDLMVRLLVMANWARLSMKCTSFLVECNQNEEVFNKSSMMSLLYYLLIPHLIYKHEYPRARSIRWIKLLSHMWWLWAAGFSILTLYHQHQSFFEVDLTTVAPERLLLVLIVIGGLAIIAYPVIIWFFVFENFCGFFGEALRFPYLRLFGTPREMVSGSQVAVAINIIVSNWLSRYIYIPAAKMFKSRLKAMWITMLISMLFHEIVLFYMTNFWMPLFSPLIFIGWPLALSFRPNNKCLQFSVFACMAGCGLIYGLAYIFEFLATYFSSIPDVHEASPLRLEPLFWRPLYYNLLKWAIILQWRRTCKAFSSSWHVCPKDKFVQDQALNQFLIKLWLMNSPLMYKFFSINYWSTRLSTKLTCLLQFTDCGYWLGK